MKNWIGSLSPMTQCKAPGRAALAALTLFLILPIAHIGLEHGDECPLCVVAAQEIVLTHAVEPPSATSNSGERVHRPRAEILFDSPDFLLSPGRAPPRLPSI